MTTQRSRRQLPTDGDPPRIQPLLVDHAVEAATPNHAHDDDQVEADPSLARHGLRQLRAPGSNLGRTTRRRGHGGRPRRPRPSQPYGGLPHRHAPTSLRSDTADAGRHRHRTPTPDGGRTPDTWTLRRPHRTPVTGQAPVGTGRSTGHRTPDTDTDTVTTAQPASGPTLAATPSDRTLRRATVLAAERRR